MNSDVEVHMNTGRFSNEFRCGGSYEYGQV